MRPGILFLINTILILGICSCRASKHLASPSSQPVPSSLTAAEESYIAAYKDIAVNEMKRTGIPASITLAQGMIESDYGRSRLAREANNHFGIKCHNDWSGPKIYHNDDRRNECFRKYGRPEDSFHDHSEFLRTGSRYSFLFSLSSTDYKGWAHGLKKAGYATNPDYANMLIRKIEEENLHSFDNGNVTAGMPVRDNPAGKKPVPVMTTDPKSTGPVKLSETAFVAARPQRVLENNGIRYIIVRDGDTREKIEEEFQLLRWELSRYNDMKSDFTPVPGQILYLSPKKERAEAGNEVYNTVEGDTMHMISQRYGIKLKSLYKMNGMDETAEPVPGTTIRLRNTRPAN